MNIKLKPFFVVMVAVVLVTGAFALSGCATPEKATDEATEVMTAEMAGAAAEADSAVIASWIFSRSSGPRSRSCCRTVSDIDTLQRSARSILLSLIASTRSCRIIALSA